MHPQALSKTTPCQQRHEHAAQDPTQGFFSSFFSQAQTLSIDYSRSWTKGHTSFPQVGKASHALVHHRRVIAGSEGSDS